MPANRKTPAPSNTGGVISGPTALEDILTEVDALFQFAQIPLSAVAGTANAITAVCDVVLDSNRKGQKFSLTPIFANTAATTLNIDGRGALAIKNRDGTPIGASRLAVGRTEVLENDGTAYRLLNDAPSSAGGFLRSIFAYQLASGSNGQATIAGWQKYPLNTLIQNEIPGLTFNAGLNQITLPALAYDWVDATVYYEAYTAGVFLWNVTDNAAFPGMVRQTCRYISPCRTAGKFNLSASKIAELRLYCTAATGVTSLGAPLGIASPSVIPEQYGFIELRVAG